MAARLQRFNSISILIFLFILWAAVQLGMYLAFGVRTPVDTDVYVADAKGLLSGSLPGERTIWYLGYTSFLASVFFFKGGLSAVVALQVLLSGIAGFCLYAAVKQISGQKFIALLALFLYVAWVKIHQWNFYIYTESVFTSMCIISFFLLLKCEKRWHYVLLAVPLLFTFLVRPTGFGFFVGLACYFLGSLNKIRISKGTLITVGILVVAFGAVLLNKMLGTHILIESYLKAEIIYPNISLGVQAPADLTVPPTHYPPLVRMVLFVVQNPLYFAKISSIKFFLFVSNVKPYFSWLHNLLIVTVLWPLYYFAYQGFRVFPPNRKEHYFIIGYILTQVLTVTLTTENWDGRFLVPVLPFVFILSAIGITSLFRKFFVPQDAKLKSYSRMNM
ncbi:hypothetical protein [Botryobacter ruber]|uniref:hypothetical protein n=1 Tax=Botryobacter ruber TaxID=2171629 RepID=UPI000F648CD6|nr:hypothetical protein [Botryobacter ruber]